MKTTRAALVAIMMTIISLSPSVASESVSVELVRDLNNSSPDGPMTKESFIDGDSVYTSMVGTTGISVVEITSNGEINTLQATSAVSRASDVFKHQDWVIQIGDTGQGVQQIQAIRGEETIFSDALIPEPFADFIAQPVASIDSGFYFYGNSADGHGIYRFHDGEFKFYFPLPGQFEPMGVSVFGVQKQSADQLVVNTYPLDGGDGVGTDSKTYRFTPANFDSPTTDTPELANSSTGMALFGQVSPDGVFYGTAAAESAQLDFSLFPIAVDLHSAFGTVYNPSDLNSFIQNNHVLIGENQSTVENLSYSGSKAYFRIVALGGDPATIGTFDTNNQTTATIIRVGDSIEGLSLTSLDEMAFVQGDSTEGHIVFRGKLQGSESELFKIDLNQSPAVVSRMDIPSGEGTKLLVKDDSTVVFLDFDLDKKDAIFLFETDLSGNVTEFAAIEDFVTAGALVEHHHSRSGFDYFLTRKPTGSESHELYLIAQEEFVDYNILIPGENPNPQAFIPLSETEPIFLIFSSDESDPDEDKVHLFDSSRPGSPLTEITDAELGSFIPGFDYLHFDGGTIIEFNETGAIRRLVHVGYENNQLTVEYLHERYAGDGFSGITGKEQLWSLAGNEDSFYFRVSPTSSGVYKFDGSNLTFMPTPKVSSSDFKVINDELYAIGSDGDDFIWKLDHENKTEEKIHISDELGSFDQVREIFEYQDRVCVGANETGASSKLELGQMLFCLEGDRFEPVASSVPNWQQITQIEIIGSELFVLGELTDFFEDPLGTSGENQGLWKLDGNQFARVNLPSEINAVYPFLAQSNNRPLIMAETVAYGLEPMRVIIENNQSSFSAPAPFQGPVITNAQLEGTELVISGNNLELIGSVLLGENELSATAAGNQLLVDVSDLPAGDYKVGYSYSGSEVTTQFSVNLGEITTESQESAFWTKQISPTEIKLYAKNIVGAGKVQFFHNGNEVAWVNAVDASDPKLRVITSGPMTGVNYLVRTRELVAGKNVFEIYVDSERVLRRAQGN